MLSALMLVRRARNAWTEPASVLAEKMVDGGLKASIGRTFADDR